MGKPEQSGPVPHDIAEGPNASLTAEAAVKAVKAGRAQDVDIAAQIIAECGEDGTITWTAEEERKLIRKVDWHIIPIVCFSFLFILFYCSNAASNYGTFRY